jgi:aryl-alcohol dehydrogenase-like predicted oxidoreductase
LARLGVDAIDLYQIRWPIPASDIEEGWAALAELKEQGLVRHIGVSNLDVEQLHQIQQIAPVETLQPQYSLIERDVEAQILSYTLRERIGVIVYSPMGSGLLTGKMTRARIQQMATTTGGGAIRASRSPSCRAVLSCRPHPRRCQPRTQ